MQAHVAIEIVKTIEQASDGSQVVSESIKVTRKAYTQDWANYNAAQADEKSLVQDLLRGLCDGVQNPSHNGCGASPCFSRMPSTAWP